MDKNLKGMLTTKRMQLTGLNLFYRKGYRNTSVDDILKELSLSKGAFYHHFASKEDFFVQILESLVTHGVHGMLIPPDQGRVHTLDRIADWYEKVLDTAEVHEPDAGLVLAKFLNEFKGHDLKIIDKLNDLVRLWEVNLVSTLQNGKHYGHVDRHVDAEGVALFLINSYMAVRTLLLENTAAAKKYRYLSQLRNYLKSLAPKTATA